MNWNDHFPAHFHARYGGAQAIFSLDGGLIKGQFPENGQRLVKEWAQKHQAELLVVWQKAREHQELPWIEPLK